MSFTIREVTINDSFLLFDMMEQYHTDINFKKITFTNSKSKFIRDCFEQKTEIKFLIAEFNGNVLGYCAYQDAYDLFKGPYISVKEMFVKEEYRKLGVSIFIFSNILEEALKKESDSLNWDVDISDKKMIEVQEKAGVLIDNDVLVLSIFEEQISEFLKNNPLNEAIDVHFAKNYELPDIYECLESLAEERKTEMNTDIYKLMKDGFSMNPKFKILVATANNEIVSFLSFHESYNTSCGNSLMVDKLFINKKLRGNGFGLALMTNIFNYASKNGFVNIETNISKFDVEMIEKLKDFSVFPYENVRVACYKKEFFKTAKK